MSPRAVSGLCRFSSRFPLGADAQQPQARLRQCWRLEVQRGLGPFRWSLQVF